MPLPSRGLARRRRRDPRRDSHLWEGGLAALGLPDVSGVGRLLLRLQDLTQRELGRPELQCPPRGRRGRRAARSFSADENYKGVYCKGARATRYHSCCSVVEYYLTATICRL